MYPVKASKWFIGSSAVVAISNLVRASGQLAAGSQ
jgi:hypothetical protein